MAFAELALKPGVLSVASQLLAQGTWWSSVCIRFFLGMLQKLGGWKHLNSTPLIGTCRGMHGWSDLLGNGYLACGTEQRLEVFENGQLIDITPLRQTSNNAPAFTTAAGQTAVTSFDPANGANAGDWINITIPVSIGGLILQGFYHIASTPDINDNVINAATAATATAGPGGVIPVFTTTAGQGLIEVTLPNHGLIAGSNFAVQVATTVGGITIPVGTYGVFASPAPTTDTFYIVPTIAALTSQTVAENSGNAQIEYLIHTGYSANTPVDGYGIGDYGAGDYGLENAGSTIYNSLRRWSLDNWGEDLLASPSNGPIYEWTPPEQTPATLVATAPAQSQSIFVNGQIQVLFSLGTSSGGTQYPNLLAWSDVGDYTDFTPSPTNQAGNFQIPTGSYIISGIAVGLGALIWTDLDCWSAVYEGLPFVFSFNRVGLNCGPMAARSPGVLSNAVMWPTIRGFFRYDNSGVNPFPCPVWDFMFANIDYGQLDQVFSAVNTPYNEISWFFPFAAASPYYSGSTPMGYVKFNAQDGVWDYGVSAQLQRTAWAGNRGNPAGPCEFPTGTDLAGLIQEHEVSPDADGAALVWSATSGYFDFEQGEEFGFIDLFIPDAVATPGTAAMKVTIQAADWPGDTPRVYGPHTWTPATEMLTLGVRGRQAAITIGGSDLGSAVRLGAIRYRVAPDGRN